MGPFGGADRWHELPLAEARACPAEAARAGSPHPPLDADRPNLAPLGWRS